VAQLLTRWPVCVTWWCRVPGAEIDAVVAALRREPRVRLCLSLTGPANFLVTAWTSSLADLLQLQTWLETALAGGEVVDASVILRTRKRMGWLLHPDGRSTGEVVPLAAAGGSER
jgi:DNA-binding Lrp family transcriptional regulator